MSSVLNILAMNWSVDEMEQILYSSTRQELPDRDALRIRIDQAHKASQVRGFPNTSEPAKERLAKYMREYVEAYGLLDFAISFEWFRFEKA